MQIENIAVSELKHPDVSVRKHPEAQIKELCRAVRMFGQTRPIVIDEENTVLAGNGLLEAFGALGENSIKALRVLGLSEEQKYKLMLSDNKIHSLGYDDYTEINKILQDFTDYNVPGFDDNFLRDLTKGLEELTAPELEKTDNYMRKTGKQIDTRRDTKLIVCPKCGEVIH